MPVIEEAEKKFQKQVRKTRVLTEQLSALVGLFRQKEDAWAETVERLKKAHLRELKRRERELDGYRHMLDNRDEEMKELLSEIVRERVQQEAGREEAKAPRKKKKTKKKIKMNKTVSKLKGGKVAREKLKLKDQEQRLEQIQKTVDLIKKEFDTNI